MGGQLGFKAFSLAGELVQFGFFARVLAFGFGQVCPAGLKSFFGGGDALGEGLAVGNLSLGLAEALLGRGQGCPGFFGLGSALLYQLVEGALGCAQGGERLLGFCFCRVALVLGAGEGFFGDGWGVLVVAGGGGVVCGAADATGLAVGEGFGQDLGGGVKALAL